jgi:Protein of unknown function (DUF4239)
VTSTTASLISFGCILGGSLAGMLLRSVLPERYFTDEEKDVLRLGLGLITTLSALVLGLLISTAKSSYDAKRSQVTQLATNVILVDRSLELYGSETKSVRHALRDQTAALITQIDSLTPDTPKLRLLSEADLRDFYQMIRRLSPRDDSQRSLKAEALRISLEVGKIRASALARESSSIPIPLLVVLVFWLTALFAGFGLFASRNPVVVAALCICALTVSTAIFLLLDMDQPLTGLMKVSIEPLRNAMAVIGDLR